MDTKINTQKERISFAFVFYRWVLGTLSFLAAIYLLVSLLAQALGLEPIYASLVATGMISLGIFWLLTILQYRGLLNSLTQWGIGQSVRMYHCAQLGLLPPTMRKVNQYKVPLILIGTGRSIISLWFFVQTLFLAAALSSGQFNSYIIFAALSLLALIALPFWIYSRHNKSKHKTIILPPKVKITKSSTYHFTLSQIRIRYEIRPAPEDYLPFSKQRKLVREHQEESARQEDYSTQEANKEATQPEQVLEADEIEYVN